MAEVETFFEHGRFELLETDVRSRAAQTRACMPCSLFLAVAPSFLNSGLVENFRLKHPVSVWIPTLTADRFHPAVVEQVPLVAEKSNAALRQAAERAMQNFQDLSQLMPNPGDLAPSLPIGVYVEFEYRCRLDDLAALLLGVDRTPHPGVAELRYAVASVLHTALSDVERHETRRLTPAGRP